MRCADLVEYPASSPDSSIAPFSPLPHEVLTTTLVHHQHFFPVDRRTRRAEGSLPCGGQHLAARRAADREECRARGHGAAARREVLLGRRSPDPARGPLDRLDTVALPQEARELPQQGRTNRARWRERSRRTRWVRPTGRTPRPRPRASPKPTSLPTWCSSSPNCRGRWAASTRGRKASPSRSGRPSTITTCRSASKRTLRRRGRSSAMRR